MPPVIAVVLVAGLTAFRRALYSAFVGGASVGTLHDAADFFVLIACRLQFVYQSLYAPPSFVLGGAGTFFDGSVPIR